ncbi:hypothetical protein KM864_18540 (plasmid) [Ralstonia solanacearum]|uniref:hypothetical protein n=1 Tax=Ralstonia pseudosolanacearum TaxID=1310165 RepID=UPI000DAC273E|nr:hypothetical protein [Ralstonia pseudosolanacearum]MCK4140381.1 hypothetical protein [Ralstonia pseudosolanacearum]NKG08080.1 hypothetical protein [Ralstonia solanacearum]QWF62998.1 hypothetical protein KM864_18540 [Ralstonia solanacearum]RAA04592.1 hypothetical protein DOT67_26150 [Ralstonia pseudosolanacearum]
MTHSSEPDYVLKDGKLDLNAAVRDLTERMSEMSRAVERLNRSLTGAFIASLFVDRPWLASFRLSIERSHEFDDSGGTYRCYRSTVSEVVGVDAARIPVELGEQGALDEVLAAADLEEAIECHEWNFFECGRGQGDATVTLTFRRCDLAHLLDLPEIEGTAACAALAVD